MVAKKVILLAFCLYFCGLTSSKQVERKGKSFLDVAGTTNWWGFALVKYPNEICKGDTGSQGVCVDKRVCDDAKGESVGSCAMGFGACCRITAECSATVSQNGTHLVSSMTKTSHQCQYHIPKMPNICQIRIDFVNFLIEEGPMTSFLGDCDADFFTVTGAFNWNGGPLCGNLTGQHMYFDFGLSEKINLDIYLEELKDQNWDIMVSYIECDSISRAPPGCVQYYTGASGQIESFNFPNRHQLNSHDYMVCIRAEAGMNQITYSECVENKRNFYISHPAPVVSQMMEIGTPVVGSNCTCDWLMFPGQDKFCGSQLMPVTSTLKPFLFEVRFNDFELYLGTDTPPCGPDDRNAGFCLKYIQKPFVRKEGWGGFQ